MENTSLDKQDAPVRYNAFGTWLIIGIAIGTAVGAATGQLSIGVGIGVAFGTGLGIMIGKRTEKSKAPDDS